MFSNDFDSLLMMGTTSSPLPTGSVPPGTKQFCTSTTISADLAPVSGLPAASSDPKGTAAAARPSAPERRKVLRSRLCMARLQVGGRTAKDCWGLHAQVVAADFLVGGQFGHRRLVADLPLLEHIGPVGHQLREMHVLLG